MTVNFASGASAYANAAKQLAKSASVEAPGDVKGTGTGFADLLKDAMKDVVDTQQKSETATVSAAAGKADLNSVVAAVTNAELTLQTVVAVRDKVLGAYQEILHMQI